MGDFNGTCVISGLPIRGGDKVRYLLLTQSPYCRGPNAGEYVHYIHGRWFPRVVPLRGEYDSHGGVEELQSGAAQALWSRSFREDLVELGTGENSVHDAAVTKESELGELLEQANEGRLRVHDGWGDTYPRSDEREDSRWDAWRSMFKVPKGVPTRRRVTAILKKHRVPVVASSDGAKPRAVFVNSSKGQVRIREACYEDQGRTLRRIARLLSGKYATMVRAGTGSYADRGELVVAPKPGVQYSSASKRSHKVPLAVAAVMIREDVWQALVATPQGEYDERIPTAELALREFDKSVKRLVDATEADKQFAERSKAAGSNATMPRYRVSDMMFGGRFFEWVKTPVPFTVGTGEAWEWMAEATVAGTATREEVVDFVTTLVELVRIQCLLATLRFAWGPAASGSQYGDFRLHQQYLETLASVARTNADEDDEERGDEGDEGDDGDNNDAEDAESSSET